MKVLNTNFNAPRTVIIQLQYFIVLIDVIVLLLKIIFIFLYIITNIKFTV